MDDVFKKGYGASGRFFLMKYMPSAGNICAFSITTSAKLSKKATERNLVRRRVFEILRLSQSLTSGKKYDIVFLARKSSINASYNALCADVTELLKKLP
mgnify:CR=1 FL=1